MPISSSAILSLTLATAFGTPLPRYTCLVAVAQLPGLVDAGAGPAGDGGAAERAVVERDVDLDGGIAAAIENLAAVDINDHAHGEETPFRGSFSLRELQYLEATF